jgi:serine/threonine protein kinase
VSKAGTPLFAAPELIKKLPYDEKVDLWALGCVMYLLSCGQNPYFQEALPK